MIRRALQDFLAYPRRLPTMHDFRWAFYGAVALVLFVHVESRVMQWREFATRPAPVVVKPVPKMCQFPRAKEKRGYQYLA